MSDVPAAASAQSSPLGRRFDRLRVKLFLAIAGTNAILALAAYLLFSWSFDRGVLDYLHQADVARLDALAASLAEDYGRQGNWDFVVQDREGWTERVRRALDLPIRSSESTGSAPSRAFPLTLDPRLLLFDADGRLLLGRAERAGEARRRSVVLDGRIVGQLGYIERSWLVESVERLSAMRQQGRFAAIGFGMLGAALLLGAGLAHWLTRRVHMVTDGTRALMQGDYAVRLPARGHDELAQLARDFNKLAATLAATREARSQWVADIAHELRTPLAVLRGEIEALEDGVRPLNAASLASLAHEVARLGRLVEDLHLLSTSDLGALSYHTEPHKLADIVADVVDSRQRALHESGLQLELKLEDGHVLADAARLEQVFGNLLQNSLRYTEAGGRLRIRVRRQNGEMVVDWEDSSPGVPEEELPRLTDRLYRVEASRSRASGGSGLGLAIARAIVEAHHGSMQAYSSPLGGLGWILRFPRYERYE